MGSVFDVLLFFYHVEALSTFFMKWRVAFFAFKGQSDVFFLSYIRCENQVVPLV